MHRLDWFGDVAERFVPVHRRMALEEENHRRQLCEVQEEHKTKMRGLEQKVRETVRHITVVRSNDCEPGASC